jgi:uncharacterized membrane protein
LISFVSAISFLSLRLLGHSIRLDPADYIYGIPIGLLLAFGNIAYLKALASGPIGLISAVGGISVIIPVLYDTFIGKALSLSGGSGVSMILAAVYLIAMHTNGSAITGRIQPIVLILASLAAMAFGVSDIFFKLGNPSNGFGLLLLIQLVECFLFSLILGARRIGIRMQRRHLLLILPLGLVNMLGWLAYSAAVTKGYIDIASALAYCSPVFTLLLAHFCIGEVLSRKEMIAFCMIIAGAWLVA